MSLCCCGSVKAKLLSAFTNFMRAVMSVRQGDVVRMIDMRLATSDVCVVLTQVCPGPKHSFCDAMNSTHAVYALSMMNLLAGSDDR